jgi:hypothetical protein
MGYGGGLGSTFAGAFNNFLAVGSTGYSIYAGEEQARASRQGRRMQERAQGEAKDVTVRQARIGEEAENKARANRPNLDVLLGDELTNKPGPAGIDANRLLLGRPGLLGL